MIGVYRADLMDGALEFLGWYLMLAAYAILGGGLILGAVVLYLAVLQRRANANRPVDGAFPLQRYKLRDGRTLIVNPNTMISPAAYVDKRTGYSEWEHPAGWEVVARVRELVERANMVRAMFPGDQARQSQYGAMSEPPRMNESTMKLIEAKTPLAPRVIGSAPDTSPIVPIRPIPPVDPLTAISNSPPTAPAVGQTAGAEIVRWNLAQFPHARWHGTSQGSGKTNGAKTALAGLLRNGAHVVILDRRRFKDFGDFAGKAELIDSSNPIAFVETMQRLEAIYRERDRILGDHGAANIDLLPQRLVRYVVMVTEFGTLCSVADDAGLLKPAMGPLKRVMNEAGAAGIHLVFEDQIVEKGKWPRGVAANAGAVFTGNLPANMGQAGGYYNAHQLAQFEFHHDGQVFKTWDMRPITRQLLAAAPAYDPRLAVLDGSARAVGDGERSDPTPHQNARSSVNGSERSVNDNVNEDDPSFWDELVADWFRRHPAALTGPPLGISDLARTMARYATGNDANFEAYKSRAHRLFHEFRNNVRLPNGGAFGVDTTKEERWDAA